MGTPMGTCQFSQRTFNTRVRQSFIPANRFKIQYFASYTRENGSRESGVLLKSDCFTWRRAVKCNMLDSRGRAINYSILYYATSRFVEKGMLICLRSENRQSTILCWVGNRIIASCRYCFYRRSFRSIDCHIIALVPRWPCCSAIAWLLPSDHC